MSEIIPFQFENYSVRVIADENGEPWFVAADVCAAMTLSTEQTRRLDDDEKGLRTVQIPGGQQEMVTINESGLYSLILAGKEHRNVMRDIRAMLAELYGDDRVLNFEQTVERANPSGGQPIKSSIFRLPKRETLILVSGYSLPLRAKIIDRWQELEAQVAKPALNPASLFPSSASFPRRSRDTKMWAWAARNSCRNLPPTNAATPAWHPGFNPCRRGLPLSNQGYDPNANRFCKIIAAQA